MRMICRQSVPVIPSASKRAKIHREFETPRERYRYRRYFWSSLPTVRLSGLLVGASYQQANHYRMRPFRIGLRFRWHTIRGWLIREFERRGERVPEQLQDAFLHPPFYIRDQLKWQRALTTSATPTRAKAARGDTTEH